jgi:hypothetical protein
LPGTFWICVTLPEPTPTEMASTSSFCGRVINAHKLCACRRVGSQGTWTRSLHCLPDVDFRMPRVTQPTYGHWRAKKFFQAWTTFLLFLKNCVKYCYSYEPKYHKRDLDERDLVILCSQCCGNIFREF